MAPQEADGLLCWLSHGSWRVLWCTLLVDEGPAVSIWAWKIHPYWSFLLPGSSVCVQGSINSVL